MTFAAEDLFDVQGFSLGPETWTGADASAGRPLSMGGAAVARDVYGVALVGNRENQDLAVNSEVISHLRATMPIDHVLERGRGGLNAGALSAFGTKRETRMGGLAAAIEHDIERRLYDGAVTIVSVDGKIEFDEAIGFSDRSNGTRLNRDSVFPVFSISKSLTSVLMLQRVERGEVRLDTRVCEILPAFGSKGKQRATIGQLLCHCAGLPASFPAVAPELQGDLDAVVAAICDVGVNTVPGEEVSYAPIMAHAVIAQCVRRLEGGDKRFRELAKRDLLDPLGMTDTSLGMRPDLVRRAIVPCKTDDSPGLFDLSALVGLARMILNPELDVEIPAGGFVSTAGDIFRFAEALRLGGALGDKRILSRPMVQFATRNHTGSKTNNLWNYAREMLNWPVFPANLGLGFFLRGDGMIPTYCGHLASPSAYGAMGAGTTNYWVDPERGMTMVCLTSGFLEEANSVMRFQRLSDAAIAEFGR